MKEEESIHGAGSCWPRAVLARADPIAISIAQHAINNQCTPLTDNRQITGTVFSLVSHHEAQTSQPDF